MWDKGVRAVHLPHTELILNRYWVWQVVSSGKGSLPESPDHPQLKHCPHTTAVGTGSLGLTCPGWHSHAAGVCQSQVGSPASGTHTVDEGGTPDYPGGHQRRTRLIGLWLFHKSPQWTHSSHCPTTSPTATHLGSKSPEFQERAGRCTPDLVIYSH